MAPPTFSDWVNAYLAAAPPDQAGLAATGEALALKRREVMRELIQTDPRRAIELALPLRLRSQLPASIARHLEERISGRGFFGVLIADNFEQGLLDVRREVVLDHRTFAAYVYGRRASQATKENIPLHGIAIDNLLAVHEDPVRPLEPGELAPAGPGTCPVCARASSIHGREALADVGGRIQHFCSVSHIEKLNERLAGDLGGSTGWDSSEPPIAPDSWSQGPKNLLYMRVSFPDDPGEPITEDEAYNVMDQVNQWYTWSMTL